MEILAPGARVVIRDAQWVVYRVDRTRGNGLVVHCTGLSEIVRDKDAHFITTLDKDIQILDPAKVKLTIDDSAHFKHSRLFLESLLRSSVPTGPEIYCGNKACMNSVEYQLTPTDLALKQLRQRILIADAVGLGKTMECGILLSELIRRGRGRRILVVTVKSMMTQFQKELWSRFAIPLTKLDSCGLERVRELIPANQNPFYYFDKSIISIDTLKRDASFNQHLQNATWDIIVIDEAHNVAERGKKSSLRAALAEILAERSDSLILLSATPHDGSARSFASLMNMLDPTAIADRDEYTPEDIKGLYIRRFKKDIKNQVAREFMEREIVELRVAATPEEEHVFNVLASAQFPHLDAHKGHGRLFKTLLEKALFSSPAACLKTVRYSIRKNSQVAAANFDVEELKKLEAALLKLNSKTFSRYQKLLEVLRDPKSKFYFAAKEKNDRLIIFTESLETLDFLDKHLSKDLNLAANQITTLRGNDSDKDQQEVVDRFGKENSDLRLLLATDVASEGINLHYQCNKMIHFDIPWSLMVFQQRNGRIDRYGQNRTPYIGYMITEAECEKIKGDLHILDVLLKKDEAAAKNIGDPSAFLGVYDSDKEEDLVARAMEESDATKFEAEMDARVEGEADSMAEFWDYALNNDESDSGGDVIASMPTVYPNDFTFAMDALNHLNLHGVKIDQELQSIQLDWKGSDRWCKELQYRFRHFPREIRREEVLKLSADKDLVEDAIKVSRIDENAWPTVQYLWELHPAMRWLSDKMISSYRRDEAPVLVLPSLNKNDYIYVMFGQNLNMKGQPMVVSWFGCRVTNNDFAGYLNLVDILDIAKLHYDQNIPNQNLQVDLAPVNKFLSDVVEKGKRYMRDKCEVVENDLKERLDEQLNRLKVLQEKHEQQNAASVSDRGKVGAAKLVQLQQKTKRVFDNYEEWVKKTLKIQEIPYIRIAAVLVGGA